MKHKISNVIAKLILEISVLGSLNNKFALIKRMLHFLLIVILIFFHEVIKSVEGTMREMFVCKLNKLIAS